MTEMGVVTGGKLIDVPGERRVDAARRRFLEIPVGDLEAVDEGGLIVDKASGALFRIVRSEVLEAKDRAIDVAGFYVSEDNEPIFLRRAEGASTIDEHRWQQQQEQRQQEQAREREEAAHAAFISSQPLLPVKLSDLEGQPLPTLREAAREIEASGGQLKAESGHLIISLPARLHERPLLDQARRQELLRACRVLFVAGDVVAAELQTRGRKPLVERLPDAQVLAGGGVAP